MFVRTLAILALGVLSGGCFTEPDAIDAAPDASSSGATSPSSSGDSGELDTEGTDGETTSGLDGTTGWDTETLLDCEDTPAEVAELEADIVILIDADAEVAWQALELSIAAAVSDGANVAVLMTPEQSARLPEPDCFSCGEASCDKDASVLRIEYEGPSAVAALVPDDIACVFDTRPGLPKTRHYWLFTETLSQTIPEPFVGHIEQSRARVHVSSSDANRLLADSDIARLVEATFGDYRASDVPAELGNQAEFIGSPRYACAWTVDIIPDTTPLFVLNNNSIATEVGVAGLVGVLVNSDLDCDNTVQEGAGLEEVPLEFYYTEYEGAPVAVACPLACDFIQLEPASTTVLYDSYCEE